jgi:hypothetical protein
LRTNVFSSPHRLISNPNTIASNTGVGPVIACSSGGGKLNVMATVGNNGNFDMKQTERWFVSPNPKAYSNGTIVGQWKNSTYHAHSATTVWRTITLPPLMPGMYFFFHGVNQLHENYEPDEADNVAREALFIKVVHCRAP